jgi:hypothetical protein
MIGKNQDVLQKYLIKLKYAEKRKYALIDVKIIYSDSLFAESTKKNVGL